MHLPPSHCTKWKTPLVLGVARVDEQSRIREFVEKPRIADASSKLVNAGVYLMEPEVVDRIATGRRVIIEREVFPGLASEGKLFGYTHSGVWYDIGNISDFRRANFALLENRASGRVIIGQDASIAASAQFTHPALVSNQATVEDGANLGPRAIIGRRTCVRKNAKVSETIVFDDAEIGSNSSIDGAVVGNSVSIGKDVVIQPGSIIAGHASIRDGICITCDVYVHPYKEIDKDILAPGHVV